MTDGPTGSRATTPVTVRLAADELARLECVAAGLLPAELFSVPAAGTAGEAELVLLDLEGVARARLRPLSELVADGRVGGALELLGAPTAPTYAGLRRTPASVSGLTRGVLAADPPPAQDLRVALGDEPVLLLAAAGAARADDAAHHRSIRAWQRLADELGDAAVLAVTPVPADASDLERSAVAAAYGVTLLDVRSAPAEVDAGAGAVVMLSGLSGSGKSTIAAALVALLTEERGRTVTLLDGDVVRTHLSKELGFSKADRDTNIRRIGWVAAEVAKHGGLAVCAPIAPYAATRAAVRAMVESQAGAGAFVLVHVATSLEECERRDRKGLYAKARAGLIPEFTGISDPYETPTDAEVVIDTTDTTPQAAAAVVAAHLSENGRLAAS